VLVPEPEQDGTSCEVCGGAKLAPITPHALDDADARPRRAAPR
jgi:hypothetical protein